MSASSGPNIQLELRLAEMARYFIKYSYGYLLRDSKGLFVYS